MDHSCGTSGCLGRRVCTGVQRESFLFFFGGGMWTSKRMVFLCFGAFIRCFGVFGGVLDGFLSQ